MSGSENERLAYQVGKMKSCFAKTGCAGRRERSGGNIRISERNSKAGFLFLINHKLDKTNLSKEDKIDGAKGKISGRMAR